MFSATAYNQSYIDSGLIFKSTISNNTKIIINLNKTKGVFYIHASAPPQFVGDMCNVIGTELLKMAGPCDPVNILVIGLLKK